MRHEAPDIILAHSSGAIAPLLQATRTIPIVMVNVPDPVGAGWVQSLARPGGNATGFDPFMTCVCRKPRPFDLVTESPSLDHDGRAPVRFASGQLRLATSPIPGDNGEAPWHDPAMRLPSACDSRKVTGRASGIAATG